MKRSWTWRDVLPAGSALTVCSVVNTEAGVRVEADGPTAARCPSCRRPSLAPSQPVRRTLSDVAAHGQSVTLRVRVSRWRCRHAPCETAIFADRLAAVAAPHAQRTERCGVVVHLVGHALGGRAGERLLARLGMPVSADTVVRVVKRGAPAASANEGVRVVGVDLHVNR